MADWTTISALATAGGTLALAVATYSAGAVGATFRRASPRSTRQIGLRPVLMASRLQDPPEKVGWVDDHWAKVQGGRPCRGRRREHRSSPGRCATSAPASRCSRDGGPSAERRLRRAVPADSSTSSRTPDSGRRARDLYIPAAMSASGRERCGTRDDDAYSTCCGPSSTRAAHDRRTCSTRDHEGGQQRDQPLRHCLPGQDSGWHVSAIVRHWNLRPNRTRASRPGCVQRISVRAAAARRATRASPSPT